MWQEFKNGCKNNIVYKSISIQLDFRNGTYYVFLNKRIEIIHNVLSTRLRVLQINAYELTLNDKLESVSGF